MACSRFSVIYSGKVAVVLSVFAQCVLAKSTDGECLQEEHQCSSESIAIPSLVQQHTTRSRKAVSLDSSRSSEKVRDLADSKDLPYIQFVQEISQRASSAIEMRKGVKLVEVIVLTTLLVLVGCICCGMVAQWTSMGPKAEQHRDRSFMAKQSPGRERRPDDSHMQFQAQNFSLLSPDVTAPARQNAPPRQGLPPPSSAANTGHAADTLCPQLVVPPSTECSLVVPRIPPHGAEKTGVVQLLDAHGKPVFEAGFSFVEKFARGVRRLSITTPGSEEILAFCCDGRDSASGLTIFNAKAAPYGHLKEAGGGSKSYSIVANNGSIFHIHGDVFSGNVNVENASGRLLAMAEPLRQDEGNRCFRIGPEVDAGLIAVALLGVDVIECLKAGG